MSTEEPLSNLLRESRRFPPPPEFAATANVTADVYAQAEADRLGFWASTAERLTWAKRWDSVLEWNLPFARWFPGGQLNVAYNCLDRHVEAGYGDQVAYLWEGEPGDSRAITYAELHREVCKAANALRELGVRRGDRVAIYMPMIPELPIALLACARLGAPHTVVFGGFSADALRGRILDCDARVVITADGGYRRGGPSGLKVNVDEALKECPDVRNVLVLRRTGQDIGWQPDRDVWWHEIVDRQPAECEPTPVDSDHPLFILYTSGTTAKPKGILHTTGGYLTFAAWTHWAIFDIKPDTDVYWCTADIGWVTGHTYIVYGPLANRTTSVMYEGTPDTPHQGRFWEIVQKYRVTVMYTAPTTIRTFMKWGEDIPARFDLSSLRLLGTVGEPINPEAWMWYRHHVGGDRCPIVDTWWQTETGGVLITPLPGVHTTKPGSASRPLPGVAIASSRADWVFGVARLISSARTRLAFRPGPERQFACALVEVDGAGDVGGQQVGSELDAREVQAQRGGEGLGDERLAHSGQVLDQHVPAGQHAEQDESHGLASPDHDLVHLVEHRPAAGGRLRHVHRVSSSSRSTTCSSTTRSTPPVKLSSRGGRAGSSRYHAVSPSS